MFGRDLLVVVVLKGFGRVLKKDFPGFARIGKDLKLGFEGFERIWKDRQDSERFGRI